MSSQDQNQSSLKAYYKLHARIYDLTRWAFLFGRQRLIHKAASQLMMPERILEIGCGTGENLVALAERFPSAQIVGLDLSQEMLSVAKLKLKGFGSRVSLVHQAYAGNAGEGAKFDLIVFSYSLSMINPGFDQVIESCKSELCPKGVVAVVDFHESRWSWFRRWMGVNHVRMEGQILDELRKHFQPLICQVNRGYVDLWRYLTFIGK